nr:gamma-glutamyl hydrolase A-like [Cherax quadricarinatus]
MVNTQLLIWVSLLAGVQLLVHTQDTYNHRPIIDSTVSRDADSVLREMHFVRETRRNSSSTNTLPTAEPLFMQESSVYMSFPSGSDGCYMGLTDMVNPHSDRLDKKYTSYIAASYVKFLESAGARVVPILTYQDNDYYENLAGSLNGILFPGGITTIDNSSGYGTAGKILYDYVLRANAKGIYLPLWGICLGMIMVTYLSTNNNYWYIPCHANNVASSLDLQDGTREAGYSSLTPHVCHMPRQVTPVSHPMKYMTAGYSRLTPLIFRQTVKDCVRKSDQSEAYNTRLHHTVTKSLTYCILLQSFEDSGLSDQYKLIATSWDTPELEYVALLEHRDLPIFTFQFHPEKNLFEWAVDTQHSSIPHTPEAVEIAQNFANFFVDQGE